MSAVTYNLGPVALIPLGEGRLFEAGNATIAVFRTRDGHVYAAEPWCPHRGGPLADGIVAAGKVVCPLHGYMFELETGAPIHHECRRLRTYAVRLNDNDDVLVTIRRRDARPAHDESPDVDGEFQMADQSAELADATARLSRSMTPMAASAPPSPPASTHQGARRDDGVRGCLSPEEVTVDG